MYFCDFTFSRFLVFFDFHLILCNIVFAASFPCFLAPKIMKPPRKWPSHTLHSGTMCENSIFVKALCAEKATTRIVNNRPAANAGRKKLENWRGLEKKIGGKVLKDQKEVYAPAACSSKRVGGNDRQVR